MSDTTPAPLPPSMEGAALIGTPPRAYLQSLTVWGVLVYLVAWGLSAIGLDIGVSGAEHLVTLLIELAQAGGLGTAIIGLRRAITPLRGVVRPPQEPPQ
jgi:hypothetical protein